MTSIGTGLMSPMIVVLQEMEMSLDDSSMGMNKTAVADGSCDSIALSEASGDSMDMSLQTTVTMAPAPRKSVLPFAVQKDQSLAGVSRSVFEPGMEEGGKQRWSLARMMAWRN